MKCPWQKKYLSYYTILRHPSLKERLGMQARSRAKEFSWHTIIHQMLSLSITNC